jgi:hypothetical protein
MMRLHRAARLASLGILVLCGLSGLGGWRGPICPTPPQPGISTRGQAGTPVDVRVSERGWKVSRRCGAMSRGSRRSRGAITGSQSIFPGKFLPAPYDRAVGTNE